METINKLFKKYPFKLSEAEITYDVTKLKEEAKKNMHKDVYKQCFSFIDLTSLNHTDTVEGIEKMISRVNKFSHYFPEMPQVGAVCVYPSMVETVKKTLTENIGIAAVSAGFPSSQTFIEVKIAETAMCVLEGANEIDIVISIGKFLSGNYHTVAEEISEIKAACRNAHLKVILESGSLKTAENIYKASILSIESGADFIKTSTGKTEPAATPEAAYVMCKAIYDYYQTTGEKIGFKPAGGVATVEEAVLYYTIVKEVLGDAWLTNELFRIGASRLANNLLTAIYDKETKYF
jgi:deoxyribose-phosphate aldolase